MIISIEVAQGKVSIGNKAGDEETIVIASQPAHEQEPARIELPLEVAAPLYEAMGLFLSASAGDDED